MKNPTCISTENVTLSTGEVRTEADFERMALEAETMDINVEALARTALRRCGRPSLGEGISPVLQVRLDDQTRQQLAERAAHEDTTPSAVIRAALHASLASSAAT